MEDPLPDDRRLRDRSLAPGEHVFVTAGRPQHREVLGKAAGGRCVGAFVVIDNDRQAQVLVRGDVVERLPGHAAGQSTVSDDRDRVPLPLTP